MDQNQQESHQSHSQGHFDPSFMQTNPHTAQFQQHLNQYEQLNTQRIDDGERQGHFQSEVGSEDNLNNPSFHQQMQIDSVTNNNSTTTTYQNNYAGGVQANQSAYYEQSQTYHHKQESQQHHNESYQKQISESHSGFAQAQNTQMTQQQQHQHVEVIQQFSANEQNKNSPSQSHMVVDSSAQQNQSAQNLNLNSTPSFRQDYSNQFYQQQSSTTQMGGQNISQRTTAITQSTSSYQQNSQMSQSQYSQPTTSPQQPREHNNLQSAIQSQQQHSAQQQREAPPNSGSPQFGSQQNQPMHQQNSSHNFTNLNHGSGKRIEENANQQQINQQANFNEEPKKTFSPKKDQILENYQNKQSLTQNMPNQQQNNSYQQNQQQVQSPQRNQQQINLNPSQQNLSQGISTSQNQVSQQINTATSQVSQQTAQNRQVSQTQQPSFMRPPMSGQTISNPDQSFQHQQIVNSIIAHIKKGDIDQVVSEINRSGIDPIQLNDDANFKQHLIFSCTIIPDDAHATKMAEVLKKMGVNPGQVDTLSQTPLYYACREGKNQLVEYLIEHGCNVNHIDTYGQNPIFYACREGKLETIKKLIQHNAQIDLIDNNGQTPLFYAVKHGKLDVVELLISHGANVNVVDKRGITPISLAKRNNKGQIIDLLIKHGAPPLVDPNQKVKGKKQPPPPQPPKQKINERKIPAKYQLTFLKDGVYQPVTEEEFENLKREYPEIAKYFDLPEGSQLIEDLPIPEVSETAPIYDCWDKAAQRLVNHLWKHQNAWIFHEPVDPVKLNLPDYLTIIKQPMDLSTVKQKLKSNDYTKIQDFLYDVQLIFDNCILYNGESSQVSLMCKSVREEFQKQYHILNLDFYV